MPHFGLVDEKKLTAEEAALLRARLHIRSGRRILKEGNLELALSILYDALGHGLKYYKIKHELVVNIKEADDELHKNELAIARELRQSGVLADLDFIDRFCALINQALDGVVAELNPDEFLASLDAVMIRLGVMPFAEEELPPEEPGMS